MTDTLGKAYLRATGSCWCGRDGGVPGARFPMQVVHLPDGSAAAAAAASAVGFVHVAVGVQTQSGSVAAVVAAVGAAAAEAWWG